MPAPARRRLREKLEFLGAGLWDAGVRVKKLKGLSRKVVFEARLSRGDRLLFTLGHDRERSLIYVWSLVSHDDISRGARRVGAQNAPFLHFEAEEREEREELTLGELTEDYFSQEPLEAKVREEYGPQKWLVLDDAEWERVLKASETDDLSLHLYLTTAQARFLSMDPPLLLSGTAGSGKTTIAVYYLLRPEYRDQRRLFVTYSPFLKRFSERIYGGLVRHAVVSPSAEPEFAVFRDLVSQLLEGERRTGEARAKVVGYREFERIYSASPQRRSYDSELVWEEIRSIIKGAKPALSPQRFRALAESYLGGGIAARDLGELKQMLLDLERLELSRDLRRRTADYEGLVRGMDTRARSDEERKVLATAAELLEKRAGRASGPLLSYAEYAELGAKRAPNFRYDRKGIYRLAEFYQAKLDESGAEDDVDRARRALTIVSRGGDTPLYDLVVCDEVQDFCDLEIALLLRLARSSGGVVLAGDVKQIINPSGFRWEEVRRSFYERGLKVPEVIHLNLNFRCVGNIVRLANAVLDLKQRLVGIVSSETREEWKFNGKPPLLLSGPEEAAVLRDVDLKVAGRIVIVRTREEKDHLSAELGSELVFTIHEAKGLEFDTVLLWRFLAAPETVGLWRQVLSRGAVEIEHEPHVRQELSLLYVALTRARNGLVLYEGREASPVWLLEEFRGLLFRTSDPAELAGLWERASSPEDWERQGDYFLEREYWKAAEECFRNAGNEHKARIASARRLEEEGRYGEAAPLYEQNGMRERAAESWESAGELSRAMDLWKALGQGERFRLCRARLYERQGEHGRAAEEWEKLGNTEGALRNWERGGMWDRVGRYWQEWKQYRRAADAFERSGLLEDAARNLVKAKEPARAAELYERARIFAPAAALYRRLGNEERLLACLLRIPDLNAAAALHEKRGELSEAIGCLRRLAGQSEEAAQELRREMEQLRLGKGKARQSRAVAVRAAALGEHAEAARLFEETRDLDLALREWRKIGDHLGAARCLAAQGKAAEAARLLERHEPGRRELITEYLDQSLGRGDSPDPARLDALVREAERLERSGDIDAALLRYRLFDADDKLLDLYALVDRDEEALERFLRTDRGDAALRFLERKPRVRVSHAFVEKQIAALREATAAGRANWFAEGVMDLHARLVTLVMEAEPAAEATGRAFLDLLPDYIGVSDRVPQSLCSLALRLRHYNAIQMLLWSSPRRGTEGKRDLRASFLAELKTLADSTGDRVLLASWASVMDPPRFDELLGGIELAAHTVRLFEASPALHARAVSYHSAGGDWERSATLHRWWGERVEAAALYEGTGDLKTACTLYREAKEHARALACAQRAGDEIEMARAYEGLRQYQRAVDIWSSLGRKRDVERVRKRLYAIEPGRAPTADVQPGLFEGE